MKNTVLIGISLLLCNVIFTQVPAQYFQQFVDYTIDVELNDDEHVLTGNITFDYTNNSPDTLNEMYIHLWGNAYKDRTTQFAKQQLRNNNVDFHFAKEEERGNFSSLAFQVDESPVEMTYVDNQWDVVKILLPNGLQPDQTITISTPFELKIPESFSRLGHVETSYQMTQWYPKPAVYDHKGWHPMPYLTQGEFYSEFGNFEVTITLPENYYVGATGVLQTEEEQNRISQRIIETQEILNDTTHQKDLSFPESSSTMKTIRYKAENVHDFAWFADKRFFIEKSNVKVNGNTVDTYTFFTDEELDLWRKGIDYVNRSVEFYSEHVGDYPYPHATAVQSALSAGGGMEYPMITVIGAMGSGPALDQVITHEVGHNWFYGILGFNERDYPWLDEGINSYYDHRYMEEFYGNDNSSGLPAFISKNMDRSINQVGLLMQQRMGRDQGPTHHSIEFTLINYFLEAYEKPALAFSYLEHYLGTDRFDKVMKDFYDTWAFKHPGPNDFIGHFSFMIDQDLRWFWEGIIGSNEEVDIKIKNVKVESQDSLSLTIVNKGDIAIPYPVTIYADEEKETIWFPALERKEMVTIPYDTAYKVIVDIENKSTDINTSNNIKRIKSINYPKIGLFTSYDKSRQREVYLTPALGYNMYDGAMLGLALHNFSFPMQKLKGSIVSMYGFSSKEIVGTAFLQYDHIIKSNVLQKIQYSIFSKQFSLPGSENLNGETIASKYGTIVPRINFIFHHDPITETKSALKVSTFVIDIQNPYDASDEIERIGNFYSRIEYLYEKTKEITPWKIEPFVEYQNYVDPFSDGSIRYSRIKLGLESNFSYQFKKGRFLKFRLFTALFPYLEDTKRAQGNISAVHSGYSDYLYENYFIGREEYNNFAANEIKIEQGGFRLGNTTVYQHFISTNSYYAGLNTTIDLPILFGNLIGLYADVGVIGSSRQQNDNGLFNVENNFIYTGGIKIGFDDYICVYFPLLVSDNIDHIYPNYGKKIGFFVNLNNFDPVRLFESINF